MLKLALSAAKGQHDFFLRTADNVAMPEVKALLMVLAESEEKMMGRIQHMLLTGIVDELTELNSAPDRNIMPDETPFDPSRAETDPRIYVCNMSLEKSIKTYAFYLAMAAKSQSELISTLFEYLALLKMRQIAQLRRVCSTF